MSPEAPRRLADGPYELIEVVGRGGMGEVWRSRHLSLDRPAAVKLLLRRDCADEEWLDAARRLRDEARATARVAHPALVELYDTGEDPDLGPWIAFEFLGGGNLRQTLRARGSLPLAGAMDRVAEPLLSALAALHGDGTVHRDVKPENLLAAPDGRFKLGDLGLAVFADREAKTKTGILIGTPGYMPPETFGSASAPTPGGDVYAAAMVLIETLAGRLPFDAPSAAERMRQQLTTDPSASFLQALGVPPPLAPALAGAVARDPGRRTDSALALLEALRKAAAVTAPPRPPADEVTRSQGRGVALPTRTVTPQRGAAPPAATGARPPAAAAAPPSRSLRLALPLVLIALLLGLALTALNVRTPGPREGDAPELVHLRHLLLGADTAPREADLTRLALLLPPQDDPDLPASQRGLLHLIRWAHGHGGTDRALRLMPPLLETRARPELRTLVNDVILPDVVPRARSASRAWFDAARHRRDPGTELRATIDETASVLRSLPRELIPEDRRADIAQLRLRLAACRADPPARLEAVRLARLALADPPAVGGEVVAVLRSAIIVLLYSAGPIEPERRIARSLIQKAMDRAPAEGLSPDEVARLRFLEATVHLRALTGDLASSQTGVRNALRVLQQIDPAPLSPPVRNLRRVLLALAAACGSDPRPMDEVDASLQPSELLPEDRWWFYRARTEPSLLLDPARNHPDDVRHLYALTPDLYINYLTMGGTTSTAADAERYGEE